MVYANFSAFCGWTFGVRVGMNLMMGALC